MSYRKLWIAFIAVVIGSFAILGYYGAEIYRMATPIPDRVVTTEGKELFSSPRAPWGSGSSWPASSRAGR